MKALFADTFYFLALLDSREKFHRQATQYSRDPQIQIVTTEWVLAEFGNAYSDPRDRADFINLYRILIIHPRVKIIGGVSSLFKAAWNCSPNERTKNGPLSIAFRSQSWRRKASQKL